MERFIPGSGTNAETVRQHMARYEFAAAYVKGKCLLDVACGAGYGSSILKEAGAQRVYGVDVSEEAISYARAHYASPDLTFIAGNAEDLRCPEKVDVVVSFETIEHLGQPDRFFAGVVRCLSDPGLAIISTPIRRKGSLEDRPANPYHLREWNQAEFTDMLGKYFREVTLFGQYNYETRWYPYSRRIRMILSKALAPAAYDDLVAFHVRAQAPSKPRARFAMEFGVAVCLK